MAGSRLQDIHTKALADVMPQSVMIRQSSDLYSQLGADTMELVLAHADEELDRGLRAVSTNGKIVPATQFSEAGIFGIGPNPGLGTLPPLEATMAVECLVAGLQNNANDNQIVHVAGPHMIEYTKQPEIMEPVQRIAGKVCAELGLMQTTTIEYVLPGMSELLAATNFPHTLPNQPIVSQHDMVQLNHG